MLFAILNPAIPIVQRNDNPFVTPVTISADLITASARPYNVGAEVTNFEVLLCASVKDANGNIINATRLSSTNVSLTAAELASWGTDDTSVLEAIFTKNKLAFTTTVNIPDFNN